MKRLASRSTWWHTLPHKSEPAVNAAVRRRPAMAHLGIDVPRGEARSVSWPRGAS
jgi:hypothetical protein